MKVDERGITDLQAVELIQMTMEEIPSFQIHYTFKEMKLKNMHPPTREKMRGCMAIHATGLPITTELLAAVLGFSPEEKNKKYGLSSTLHTLGDKNCLILKRGKKLVGKGGPYEWVVHPVFLKHFYREGIEEDGSRENHRT